MTVQQTERNATISFFMQFLLGFALKRSPRHIPTALRQTDLAELRLILHEVILECQGKTLGVLGCHDDA